MREFNFNSRLWPKCQARVRPRLRPIPRLSPEPQLNPRAPCSFDRRGPEVQQHSPHKTTSRKARRKMAESAGSPTKEVVKKRTGKSKAVSKRPETSKRRAITSESLAGGLNKHKTKAKRNGSMGEHRRLHDESVRANGPSRMLVDE